MSEEVKAPLTDIELLGVLGEGLLTLVRTVPQNSLVRGLVLQKILKPIPDEIPPEQFLEWIRNNVIVSQLKLPIKSPKTYRFPIKYTEVESGYVDYEKINYMRGNIELTNNTLIDLWNDVADIDEFRDAVHDYLKDEESDNGYCDVYDNDIEHGDNYESQRSNRSDWEVNTDIIDEFLEDNDIE